ncbi:WD-40 repeat protein [Nostoc commune NIES-4072]|uniref:WD-40 repeat protein n=1 Tax=Nostoc commune NIES-4072 TaxID=2005467 RepID=A0A2R5FRQ5_NOSCO|nr:caspase family protein [Nostoc commune]BBD68031.1 WD-40 repeat protein [Nostoc commune HK-02]GBG20975.1 WD-40 repeat protein [Nostoc commune NIES-4072]
MSKHKFNRNFAIIIGINDYINGIRELETAVPDAHKLAQIIQKQHQNLKQQYQAQNKYEVQLLLNKRVTFSKLKQLIEDFKQGQIPFDNEKVAITESDRVLFYFAGHGIALEALENQEGPVGYLIPQDATLGDSSTYLPMQELHDALNALPCRHLLAILDCCFAGAFRWASLKREILPKVTVYKERYDRFISDAAWQVITSAADDQKALDSLGQRGKVQDGNEVNSPFAKALFDALRGDTEESADLNKDGIITATELYSYLRDQVEILTENHYKRQTPGLCPLRKHDKGEFIFLLPNFDRDKLEDAPPLIPENNPYRGLESYDEKDSNLFFGRENLIKQLYQHVVSKQQALTVVLGASGTGKSSLMKAGLLPRLRHSQEHQFQILQVMRPGETPLEALAQVCSSIATGITAEELAKDEYALATIVENRCKADPKTQLLLPIDQFEELITLCKSDEEREQFLRLIKNAVAKFSKYIDVIATLRLDFEAQFQNSVLKDFWNDARFVVPPMTQDELREAIEKPASEKVVYFEPPSLVDELINEVVQMPGALPLLSFTLSQLYLKYLEERRDNRALKKEDYEKLGRVVGSLTKRANQEYERLVAEDIAYKNTVRRVMLRMISLEGGELARRQVPKSELVYPEQEESDRVQTVIKRFSEARLIIEGSNPQGEPYVEPAHDALVQGWDKLLTWKKEEEENLILQRRLTPAAEEWNNIKEQEKQPNSLVKTWEKAESLAIGKIQTWRRNWQRRKQEETNISRGSSVKSIAYLWDDDPRIDQLNQVLDADDRTNRVQRLHNAEEDHQSQYLKAVAFSPDGKYIAAVKSTEIMLWDINGNKLNFQQQEIPSDGIQNISFCSVVFSHDSKSIYTGECQGDGNFPMPSYKVEVWRTEEKNKSLIQEEPEQNFISQQGQQFLSLAASADGMIASGSTDGTIHLSHSPAEVSPILRGHTDWVNSIAFSPKQKQLVSASNDGTIRLWDLSDYFSSAKVKYEVDYIWDNVHAVAFNPNNNEFAIARKNSVMVFNKEGNHVEHTFDHLETVNSIAYSPDGKTIVSGADDKTLRLWDLEGNKPPIVFQGHEDKVTSVAFSPDGKKIVSGSKDNTLRLWNLQGNQQQVFQGHQENTDEFGNKGGVNSVAFSPDGKTIVSGADDKTLRLWDLEGNKPPIVFRGHEDKVTSVAFSPDSKKIVSGSADKTLRFWDLKGRLVSPQVIKGHTEVIRSVAFSPDGKMIISAGADNMLKFWNLDGSPAFVPFEDSEATGRYLSAFAISPDSKTILSSMGGTQYFSSSLRMIQNKDNWEKWLELACNRLHNHPVLLNPQTDAEKGAKATCEANVWNRK